MVASIRPVARMSSAGVSWKPFGKRASGPVVLFDLAMQVTPSCGEWVAAAAYSGCEAERKGGAPKAQPDAPASLGEERAGQALRRGPAASLPTRPPVALRRDRPAPPRN